MSITPKATLCKNINELQEQCYDVYDNKKPVPDNIPNPKTQRDTPTYKPWGWNDIDHRKVSGQHHERDRMSDFGE